MGCVLKYKVKNQLKFCECGRLYSLRLECWVCEPLFTKIIHSTPCNINQCDCFTNARFNRLLRYNSESGLSYMNQWSLSCTMSRVSRLNISNLLIMCMVSLQLIYCSGSTWHRIQKPVYFCYSSAKHRIKYRPVLVIKKNIGQFRGAEAPVQCFN